MIQKTSPLRRATLMAAACLALCSGAAFAEVKAKIGHAMPDSHPQAMAMNKFSELAAQYIVVRRRGIGTEVTFKPSALTFTRTEFEFAVLERRLRDSRTALALLGAFWLMLPRTLPGKPLAVAQRDVAGTCRGKRQQNAQEQHKRGQTHGGPGSSEGWAACRRRPGSGCDALRLA